MDRDNLAARAGRWSAAHWKTATFGWIAFVVVAVAIGNVTGSVKLSDSEQATGEAARAQAILGSAGFSQPAAENVLVKSTTADDRRSGVPRHRRADRREAQHAAAGAAGPVAADAGRRERDLGGPARRARAVLDPRQGRQRRQADPAGARRGRVAAEAEPRLHRRGVRLREREPRAERHDRQGLPEGGAALRADHVPDPALRVRLVRRSRRARAARVHRGARVDRARRGWSATSRTRPTRPTP